MRNLSSVALFAAAIALAGCGGGGESTSANNNSPPTSDNVQAVTVNSGVLGNSVNALFTSVIVCAPGRSDLCQTIDHILVDTGSSGLRLMASKLSPAIALPAQTDNSINPLHECFHFADGFTWGTIQLADVRIAGKQANSVPVQVIGDAALPQVPDDCSATGPAENTVATFGANGILGIGVFEHDFGPFFAQNATPGVFYSCPSGVCAPVAVSLEKQIKNPVSMFATDNNGVIVRLPSIPPEGARNVTGSLIFGIGTRDNNALGSAQIIPLDPVNGMFTTTFNGGNYNNSFIDSGSNGIFFPGPGIPKCGSGFYCPATTLSFTVTIHGKVDSTATFKVSNANALINAHPSFTAFSSLAAENLFPGSFDFGLPFFYGRTVYTAIENRNTGAGNVGPYFAY